MQRLGRATPPELTLPAASQGEEYGQSSAFQVVTRAAPRSREFQPDSMPAVIRALRPAQWIKNGVVFAGVVFGGRLLDPSAFLGAAMAAVCFCLLSSGFYLLNDVRDLRADRVHPLKRLRPVAAGALSVSAAVVLGVALVVVAIAMASSLGPKFVLVALTYTALMTAYNLGLKQMVILDVFAIATGFVLRAVAGAVAVDVAISPWLLVCTMLLALLIGFGKRRSELLELERAALHRRNLESYSASMLDQSLAVTAAGALIAYAVYTFGSDAAPHDHRMMLTIPIVAYAIFRYLYLLYRRGLGGAPETMLLTDRPLLTSLALWSIVSTALFYLART
jgi:4-hydroxybenzoate polyprenyltransferase